MAIGKKSAAIPEVGDLVTSKAETTHIYENSDASTIIEQVPAGVNLGILIMIAPNELGIDVYVIDKGAVFSDEVTTKVNPVYNYGGDPASKTTTDTNTGFWSAFNSVFSGVIGLLNRKKTVTTEGTSTDETVKVTDTAAKNAVPIWVWLVIGGVGLTGVIVALAWPRKKPQPTPQEPFVLRNEK